MAALTVHELPEAADRKKPQKPLGTLLHEIGREVGLTEEEYALFTSVRDKTPAKPFTFDDK